MTPTRVLGTCYVCGRKVYGFRAQLTTTTHRTKGGAYRDSNGIRHGGCTLNVARTVTPSDS